MKRLASCFLLLMMLFLAACGEGGLGFGPKDEPGVKSGRIGDTMSTAWFDFTVTDAYCCGQYQGYAPSEGYQLVVVAMSLTNNRGRPVDVWGEDFMLLWGDGDDTLDIPLPAGLGGNQFPDRYVLDADETKNGVMVFEAPREFREFCLGFMEIFESSTNPDGERGSTFFVEFTAEDR